MANSFREKLLAAGDGLEGGCWGMKKRIFEKALTRRRLAQPFPCAALRPGPRETRDAPLLLTSHFDGRGYAARVRFGGRRFQRPARGARDPRLPPCSDGEGNA